MNVDQPVLRVLESTSDDGTLVLSLQGAIDLATVNTLAAHLDHVCDRADAVTVDLRRVGFIDCLGLRHLLTLHADADARGSRVGFIQGPTPVRRVFELTGALEQLSSWTARGSTPRWPPLPERAVIRTRGCLPPPCLAWHEGRKVRPMNSSSLQHATAGAINRDRVRASRPRRRFR